MFQQAREEFEQAGIQGENVPDCTHIISPLVLSIGNNRGYILAEWCLDDRKKGRKQVYRPERCSLAYSIEHISTLLVKHMQNAKHLTDIRADIRLLAPRIIRSSFFVIRVWHYSGHV